MAENVKILSIQNQDFKEYIELWIHEVKIPISSLVLIAHNHPDKFDKKTLEQIRRIEDYVEQVLYYVRSENASVDYLINKVSLNKVIGAVALKNKNDLLENKIDLIVSNTNSSVYTDSKWLEFILNQIINNSIKYHDKKDSYIKTEVYCLENKKFFQITKIIDGNIQVKKIYSDGEFVNIYTDDESGKHAQLNQKMELSVDMQNYLYTDNIFHLASYSIPASVKSKDYYGKKCYYIANFDTPYSISEDGIFIDKETGLIVKAITSVEVANGITPAVDYVYEFGNVTEKDFVEPNIEDYKIID